MKPRFVSVEKLRTSFGCHGDGRLICLKTVISGNGKIERKVGDLIQGFLHTGYRKIKFEGKAIAVHRVVFAINHGYLPDVVDHCDGNKTNNTPDNLREASVSLNVLNRHKWGKTISGIPRVGRRTGRSGWYGRVTVNGKLFATKNCKTKYEAALLTRALVAEKLEGHL